MGVSEIGVPFLGSPFKGFILFGVTRGTPLLGNAQIVEGIYGPGLPRPPPPLPHPHPGV